eukprot:3644346-Pyramimonas_sp.AAC.1
MGHCPHSPDVVVGALEHARVMGHMRDYVRMAWRAHRQLGRCVATKWLVADRNAPGSAQLSKCTTAGPALRAPVRSQLRCELRSGDGRLLMIRSGKCDARRMSATPERRRQRDETTHAGAFPTTSVCRKSCRITCRPFVDVSRRSNRSPPVPVTARMRTTPMRDRSPLLTLCVSFPAFSHCSPLVRPR